VAHGCTGKGNDQVRFELGVKAFAPEMEVIAPWRTWGIQSREEEIEYLEKRNIPVPMKKSDSYSRDDNLWHISHEGLDLEDPANEPKFEGMLKMTVPPEKAPDKAEYVTIGFEKGMPISVNGEKLAPIAIVKKLNEIGGKHGVGIVDMVENRVVGMKSRGVYETPGGAIIMEAHDKLEQLCLTRKPFPSSSRGAAFRRDPLRRRMVLPALLGPPRLHRLHPGRGDGTVTVKLYKGSILSAGATSPYSLYDASLALYDGTTLLPQGLDGFINLFGLPTKVRARLNARIASHGSAAGPDVVKPAIPGILLRGRLKKVRRWQSFGRAPGRGGLNPDIEVFLSSLSVDSKLLGEDIECSIAHVQMLGRQGILPRKKPRRYARAGTC